MYTAKKRRQTKGVYGAKGTFKKPRAQRAVVPGITRQVGYYGRYGPNSGEKKFWDVSVNDASISQAGTVVDSLNELVQGTSESQRIGRKATIKNVHCRYNLSLNEQDAVATPASGDTVRFIVFLDKQCNGATAATTDILESDNYQSYRNLANIGRFDILYDKMHVLKFLTLASDGAGVVSSANVEMNSSVNLKCNIPVEFNGTTGVIAEIRSNNIGFLIISRVGNLVVLDSHWRLRFTDGN